MVQLRTEAFAQPVPESAARPTPALKLTSTQEQAVDTILDLMAAAIEGLRVPPADADFARASRIAMLSGDRGTGKTTVMLHLERACREWQTRDVTRDEPPYPWRKLAFVARRTVWLETLDMEPLPNSTNLLAAILARVEAVARDARRLGPVSGSERHGTRGLLERGGDEPLLELQRFQMDVARSWDGNLPSRQGSLDLDAYAVELFRAERSRLSLNDNMSRVLDRIASLFGNSDPIFILPVDDFDLNPPRSLDLLRILRAISVPRLFTLILGDARVAELIFNLRLFSEFAKVAQAAADANLMPPVADEVNARSTELAGHAVRKLLPPTQTLRLEAMTTTEALCYRPAPSARLLYDLLVRCKVDVNTATGATPQIDGRDIASLRDLLLIQSTAGGPLHGTVDESPSPNVINDQVRAGAYHALDFLHTSARRVADLWLEFNEVTRDDIRRSGDPLNNFLGAHCKRTLREDGHLLPVPRIRMLESLRTTAEGLWQFDTQAVEIQPQTGQGRSYEVTLVSGRARSRTRTALDEMPRQLIHVAPARGWNLYPRAQGTDTWACLEPLTAATLMLFQDVHILDTKRANCVGPLAWKTPLGKWCAKTEWRLDNQRSVAIGWNTPIWDSFWEHDVFFALWNDSLPTDTPTSATGEQDRLPALLFRWIDAATAVLAWQPPIGVTGQPRLPDWKALVKRVAGLVPGGSATAHRGGAPWLWIIELGKMLMPEVIGVHAQITREFARSEVIASIWQQEVYEIRHKRDDLFRRFRDKDMPEVGQYFRTQVPTGFPQRLARAVPSR
jgi:hypothetical protein